MPPQEKVLQHEHKRILFLCNHFISLYAFRLELITRLLNEGHDVYISIPESPDDKCFVDLGCRMLPVPMDRRGVNPVNDIKTITAYFALLRKVKPNIIFSYTIKPNIYGSFVSNILGYKQVCNITGTGATFLKDNFISRIATILYRLSVKHCYKVFFQNDGDKDLFLKRKMVGNNWEVLPGSGVNLSRFKVIEFPPDDEIAFIFIGRVFKVKGIDQYLEAARIIKGRHSNVVFYIAGWIEEKQYEAKISEYEKGGFVKYAGFQKNIADWIQKCQCTILPSLGGEGVPNSLLETAASGRVCIASDIPGSKNIVDEGVTGYLFEAGNAESLVSKIEEFLKLDRESRKTMGLKGREKVEREFDREIVIQKYLDEVHSIK